MHHIYHTEGIILGSRSYGETGKYYHIFTKDLGMIRASAQGVRKMSSKLRFVLQDFSYIKIDLVRGRDFWRVTSASKTNKLENIKNNILKREIMANLAVLIKRLLSGEESNEILFQDVLLGLYLIEEKNLKEDIKNTEAILVLRMLYHLGYVALNDSITELIKSEFDYSLLLKAEGKRKEILKEINKALKETNL